MLTPRIDRLDRNYLINSAKDFAQRSTAAENLTGSYQILALDRHAHKTGGSFNGTPTVQRVQDSPDGKTKYCSEIVADFAASTSELFEAQTIESVFARDLVNEVVSYSMYVKSSSCTTVELNLYTADVEDDFTAVTSFATLSTTITADNTWQLVEFGDIAVGAGAERGILVEVVLTDSDSTGVTEQHRITRAKLNIGAFAQEWGYAGRDYWSEAEICLIYYEKSYDLDQNPGTITDVGQYISRSSNTNFTEVTLFSRKKRVIPTVEVYNPDTGAAGETTDGAEAAANVSQSSFEIAEATTANIPVAYHWTADAEMTI